MNYKGCARISCSSHFIRKPGPMLEALSSRQSKYKQTTEIASVLEKSFWGRGAGVWARCRQVHTCHRSSGAAARPTVLTSLDAPTRTMNLPWPPYTSGCAEFIGILGRMVSPVTADPAAARHRNPPSAQKHCHLTRVIRSSQPSTWR